MTTNTIVTEVSELIKKLFGEEVKALGDTDTDYVLDGISVCGTTSPHIKLTFQDEESDDIHFVDFDLTDESFSFDMAVNFFFFVYEDLLNGEKYDSPIEAANILILEDDVSVDHVTLDGKRVWLAS